MPAKIESSKKEEPSFETAVERLEAIVEQMESSKLPLDELLTRYEEGVKLVKFCSEKLNAAEKKIEIITRTANGDLQTEEFENDKKTKQTKDAANDEVSLF